MLSPAEWSAVRLTAELAGLSTVLLLIVGTPTAWWLARTRSRLKPLWAALVAMHDATGSITRRRVVVAGDPDAARVALPTKATCVDFRRSSGAAACDRDCSASD